MQGKVKCVSFGSTNPEVEASLGVDQDFVKDAFFDEDSGLLIYRLVRGWSKDEVFIARSSPRATSRFSLSSNGKAVDANFRSKVVASVDTDGNVIVSDFNGQQTGLIETNNALTSLKFNNDGNKLLVGLDSTFQIFERQAVEPKRNPEKATIGQESKIDLQK